VAGKRLKKSILTNEEIRNIDIYFNDGYVGKLKDVFNEEATQDSCINMPKMASRESCIAKTQPNWTKYLDADGLQRTELKLEIIEPKFKTKTHYYFNRDKVFL